MNSNSRIISTDEDPSLRIESSAIINLRGVSTKLNKYNMNLVFHISEDGYEIELKRCASLSRHENISCT